MADLTGPRVRAREEFEAALADAGLVDIGIAETHRVHEHAVAAIIGARRPTDARSARVDQETCCAPDAKDQYRGAHAATGSTCR